MSNTYLTYLDYNSTTPIDPRVLDAMLPFLKDNFANPSSTHHFGQSINENVKQARQQIADFINAESNELIFTSGATEAINIAIKGVAENYSNKGKHIITVSTEHKAVLDTCKDLERKGFEATYLSVLQNGLIDLSELQKAIRPDTILVSVMYVNNETGVIQPIKDISKIAHEKGALFMTDATQAVGKIEIDVDDLGIDLLCFSGHKMYAPKGIGALYVRQRGNKVILTPQVHGGGHEQGLRSGTLNVPGVIALAKACEIAS
ncbi:MAG: cysteine desulfurase family protein, partial [Flavobacteriaceae bacterium]|nr:cysteine desulfurase family protein [Flavobacteriaceae bacterium]